ncbi:phosphotransferase [Novosphingobium bradum]|uniref:Phosphotransferase n=1 Tax=Novosphingobium bradum TaxID=1737444 RepID=A0ABV7IPQ3_9SPHN
MTKMNALAPDIRRPDQLDPAWFTRALQAAGFDAEIAAVAAKPVGTGQIGDSIRFTLTHARPCPGAPASLVGKFPAADPTSFASGRNGGNYLREVRFYQQLAASARIAVPQCFYAEVDEDSGEYVLLLEDLAPARQGDQLAGVTIDQAMLVVDQAARLHASHWGDETLLDTAWLVNSRKAPPSPLSEEGIRDFWRGFQQRYAGRIGPKVIEAGTVLTDNLAAYRANSNRPRCLIHGDFRPDNIMFASEAGGHPITVLDWQSIGFGAAAVDLGYFLAGALPAEVRREHEAEMLARYHAELRAGGVTDYAEAELRADYASGGLRMLFIAIVSAMRVKQTARGDEMFLLMAACAADHCIDNDGLALLA